LLNGLEVFDEELEMALDNSFAECVAPHDFPKALAPDRHLPTAMRWHAAPAVDIRHDLGNGEVPATPLGNAREIRRGRPEG
jgi:hypothetical protein